MGTEQRNIRALSWPSQTGIVGNLFITSRQPEVLLQRIRKVVTDKQFHSFQVRDPRKSVVSGQRSETRGHTGFTVTRDTPDRGGACDIGVRTDIPLKSERKRILNRASPLSTKQGRPLLARDR